MKFWGIFVYKYNLGECLVLESVSSGSESVEIDLTDMQECFNMQHFPHLSGSVPAKIECILGCYGTANSHIPGVAPSLSVSFTAKKPNQHIMSHSITLVAMID